MVNMETLWGIQDKPMHKDAFLDSRFYFMLCCCVSNRAAPVPHAEYAPVILIIHNGGTAFVEWNLLRHLRTLSYVPAEYSRLVSKYRKFGRQRRCSPCPPVLRSVFHCSVHTGCTGWCRISGRPLAVCSISSSFSPFVSLKIRHLISKVKTFFSQKLQERC